MRGDLRAHVNHLRERELVRMGEDTVAMVLELMPDYLVDGSLTPAMLLENSIRNLEHVLTRLLAEDDASNDELSPSFYDTGVRRAQQRVPLESVLYSFRIGGRVLWQSLVREVNQNGDHRERQRLLEEAVVVWELTDATSTAVARGYRDEQARILRRGQHRREAVLSALIDGRTRSATGIADSAEALGLAVHGRHVVAVTVALDALRGTMPHPEERLADARVKSAWTTQGTRLTGLIDLQTSGGLEEIIEILRNSLPDAAVAISEEFDDLNLVADAYRQATLALRTLPTDRPGVARARDRALESLLVGSPEVSRLLITSRLGGILDLRPRDRDIFLETILAIVECGGSARSAAERLFCHRNTVVKRARRIRELCGSDLGDLESLMPVYLAALALRTDPALLPGGGAGVHR